MTNLQLNMETSEKLDSRRQLKYQYLAVIAVNLLSVSQGYSAGWLSPSLPILRSENSPLKNGPITLLDTTLLGALPVVGAFLGIVLFSIISNHLGRITTIALLFFPNMAFWIILIASDSLEMVLIGQLITGMVDGGMQLCVPLLVAEIADKRIRGFLGTISDFSVCSGMLGAFIAGAVLDYAHFPLAILPFPVIFLVSMIILPETPSSLIRQNNAKAAKKSIQFYNNGNDRDKNGFDADAEIHKLQIVVNQRERERKRGNWKLILNRQSLKGLAIGLAVIAIISFSGVYAFTSYASDLFVKSNANIDANSCVILVGVLNLLGTVASVAAVDSWGRRNLFGLSCTLSSAALMIFGTFSYFSHRGFDVSSFYWIPVASISFFMFVSAAGMRSLPFVYTAEILPNNIRHIGSTICMLAFTAFGSISLAIMPYFMSACAMHTVMWAYGAICSLGLILSKFFMDETKGKNLNDGS